jgi:hypothetical protein
MVCDQLNLMQLFCVDSIDQCRTFGVCDLGEMLKMYVNECSPGEVTRLAALPMITMLGS